MRALLGLALGLAVQSAAADTVLVRAGKLVDVDAGSVLADQAVLVVDGKVASVAPYAASSFPAGTREVGEAIAALLK